ncbi:hypothetical protein [uncultured Clostridium sp.]|uniref:hypothetical protein n=1 Tax=uncultured Clostridium sp. TaxID=59620 RepID=UPI0025D30323|nr:hypothetical protein [uncultured Clostridium sp.]
MKKFVNKALMYQSFQKAKWMMTFSLLVFFIICYFNNKSRFRIINSSIANLSTNEFSSFDPSIIILICLILFLIYTMITGTRKKEYRDFLGSGPYTKEDIKKNEILFLSLSLFIIILFFVYINVCFYFKEEYLISITSKYFLIMFKDIVRILVIGFAFIAYLLFMELLFSNTTFFIFMLLITPIVGLFNFLFIYSNMINLNTVTILPEKIYRILENCSLALWNYLLSDYNAYSLGLKYELISIFILCIATIIVFVLMWQINKKLNKNRSNKFFTFPFVESIFSYVFSFSIVNFVAYLIIESAFKKRRLYMYINEPNIINNLYFCVLLVFIIVVSYILMKPIKKIVKKFI